MDAKSKTADRHRAGLNMLLGNRLMRLHKVARYLLAVIPAQAGIPNGDERRFKTMRFDTLYRPKATTAGMPSSMVGYRGVSPRSFHSRFGSTARLKL